ncbi:uncharacterized protein PFL1_03956 [Pseudozyma flocculosa PF-1]|uniref:Uncharacterized protein n=1 Tax=Pseudozyma flocculosa PF-1 TaxID=1277687 RepID=A0A061H7P0_9BASI|nr:uncharacterized protein PFL1_03956 [Pseudozyma flocculosa PF-1]EPQ28653.1 hypothetical protein PFL1_03956 [Pseudozyma flocculosa PF-1]
MLHSAAVGLLSWECFINLPFDIFLICAKGWWTPRSFVMRVSYLCSRYIGLVTAVLILNHTVELGTMNVWCSRPAQLVIGLTAAMTIMSYTLVLGRTLMFFSTSSRIDRGFFSISQIVFYSLALACILVKLAWHLRRASDGAGRSGVGDEKIYQWARRIYETTRFGRARPHREGQDGGRHHSLALYLVLQGAYSLFLVEIIAAAEIIVRYQISESLSIVKTDAQGTCLRLICALSAMNFRDTYKAARSLQESVAVSNRSDHALRSAGNGATASATRIEERACHDEDGRRSSKRASWSSPHRSPDCSCIIEMVATGDERKHQCSRGTEDSHHVDAVTSHKPGAGTCMTPPFESQATSPPPSLFSQLCRRDSDLADPWLGGAGNGGSPWTADPGKEGLVSSSRRETASRWDGEGTDAPHATTLEARAQRNTFAEAQEAAARQRSASATDQGCLQRRCSSDALARQLAMGQGNDTSREQLVQRPIGSADERRANTITSMPCPSRDSSGGSDGADASDGKSPSDKPADAELWGYRAQSAAPAGDFGLIDGTYSLPPPPRAARRKPQS